MGCDNPRRLIPLPLAMCLAIVGLIAPGAGASDQAQGPSPPSSARIDQHDLIVSEPIEAWVESGPRDLQPTHELRVAGSVMRPVESAATYATSGSGGCVYATASEFTFFSTFLDLPHGATLLQVRFYFNDTSASDSFALLTELDYQGNPSMEWRMDSWGDTGSGYDTRADLNHVVDTTAHSYILRWRPVVASSAMQACGFRIWYHDPHVFSSGFETGNTGLWSATVQ
jgi:hypothetical protein